MVPVEVVLQCTSPPIMSSPQSRNPILICPPISFISSPQLSFFPKILKIS